MSISADKLVEVLRAVTAVRDSTVAWLRDERRGRQHAGSGSYNSRLAGSSQPRCDRTLSDHPTMISPGRHRQRALLLLSLILCLVGLAVVWRWTSLHEYIDPDKLVELVQASRIHRSPLIAIGVIIVASVIAIPLAVIIVAGAIIFGPVLGPIYVLSGAWMGAAISFALGKYLGHNALRLFAGERAKKLSESLGDSGVITVIVIRLVPAAPFAIANMLVGASHIRTRDFLLGTIVGMIPGALAITLFVDQIIAAFRFPGWQSIVLSVAILIMVVAGGCALRRSLEKSGKAAVGAKERKTK